MISTGVSAVVIAEYTTLTSDIGISSVWTIQVVDQFDVHKYALLNNKKQCCYVKYTIVRILLNLFQIYLLHGLLQFVCSYRSFISTIARRTVARGTPKRQSNQSTGLSRFQCFFHSPSIALIPKTILF